MDCLRGDGAGDFRYWHKEDTSRCLAIIRTLRKLKPHITGVTASGSKITVNYVTGKDGFGRIEIDVDVYPRIVADEIINVLSKKNNL